MVVWVSLLVFTAVLGLIAAPFIAENQGYIFISFANYTLEMSVVSGFFLLFGTCFLLWFFTRLMRFILSLNRRTQHWFKHRGTEKSYTSYQDAVLALLGQNWQRAEKYFLQYRKQSPFPLLHTLGAALAAHKQKKHVERDDYFNEAHIHFPFASEALTLQHAQLLIEERQFEPALAMLQKIQQTNPDCTSVYPLLLTIAVALNDAPAIAENVRRLRHKNIYSEDQLDTWEIFAHQIQLEVLQEKQDSPALADYWHKIPRTLRKQKQLAQTFYCAIATSALLPRFLNDIEHYLAQKTCDAVLNTLTEVTGSNRDKVINMLKKRLKKDSHNAQLHYSYAKILYDDGNLAKAKQHADQARTLNETAPVCLLLGRIMSDMRLTEKALEYYRTGLELSLQESPTLAVVIQPDAA